MQQLAFDEHGSGPHTVILLHGFPFTSAIWQAQREALGNGKRRIVTPDLPGFGRTKGSEESMEAYADDVRALIDKLGAQQVILGGFSMGGYVALAFARKYADRLEGLLLVDTKADPDSEEARVGRYALIERGRHGWTVVHVSVAYDWDAAASLAASNGHPRLAHALRHGRMPAATLQELAA